MSLLLLRHVHAGDRDHWSGDDDRHRPASPRGQRQAAALVETYADLAIDRILTSPLTRCVQSVEPLAQARGLEVEEASDLAEGTPLDVVQRRLRGLAGHDVVLCSHGDVIGAVIQDLHFRGVNFDAAGGMRWEKAGTWVLDGDPRLPAVRYLAPPA